MDKLLAFYEELLKSAEDHQIAGYLQNLIEDAAKLTAAIEAIIAETRQKAGQ